jgi:carboxyl-terminal processing protease
MSRSIKIVIAVLVAFAISLGSFTVGVALARFVDLAGLGVPVPAPDSDRVTALVEEVADTIRAEALEPSTEESMSAGAVRGLLSSLDDPYAAYLDETHYAYFNEQNEGEFFGIGVTVTEREGRAFIVSPIEGTPAFEAGLQAEDEIVSVDGYQPDEWTLEEVVTRVRGKEGTDVTLGIAREEEDDVLSFTITRARIDVPNTTSEIYEDEVGYIRLFTFNSKAASDLQEAIEDLTDRDARGLILDLRDNPGGLLDASVDVASLFVEDGVIVEVDSRTGHPEIHRARGGFTTDIPLVVLVNENSASASEIVAGALQDYERAELIGVTTFGKGSVQTVEELSNGAAVKFTTARYLTPKGRSIHKTGLEPDIEVEMDPADQVEFDTDVQLHRAIEAVQDSLD